MSDGIYPPSWVKEAIKLRELLETFFNGDNVMVKKEYKKLLERSKE